MGWGRDGLGQGVVGVGMGWGRDGLGLGWGSQIITEIRMG